MIGVTTMVEVLLLVLCWFAVRLFATHNAIGVFILAGAVLMVGRKFAVRLLRDLQ
jgi:hypothetical protein